MGIITVLKQITDDDLISLKESSDENIMEFIKGESTDVQQVFCPDYPFFYDEDTDYAFRDWDVKSAEEYLSFCKSEEPSAKRQRVEPNSLSKMDNPLMLHILQYLDAKSLTIFGQTCWKHWSLSIDPTLWKKLFQQRWPVRFENLIDGTEEEEEDGLDEEEIARNNRNKMWRRNFQSTTLW
eukprot:TRINITY_DN2812_c0_g1_i2.p1 TRINITY_DN2812_c0_g1~~TRINITY_DN2812_c0_g1_i2.p1  ORF type:complete len:181 (-),score=22.25 TRINITY_DN2812_c0_g1_i2:446-988(-)